MKLEVNEYLEIFDPIRKSFFPVRVTEILSDGILCRFLNSKKERKIFNYSLETYGYMEPSLNDNLIIDCGYTQNNIQFISENRTIVKCIVGELKESIFPYYADFSYNVFGYKFIETDDELVNIIEILKNTGPEKNNLEFKEENNSTFRIEKLRDYSKIDNETFDDIYLKNRSVV